MTAINQHFSMYQGDTKNIIITVDGATDLTGSTVKWGVREKENSADNVIMKTDASVTGNEITISLKPPDTANLHGTFYHECELTDQQQNVSTIFTGLMTIKHSII